MSTPKKPEHALIINGNSAEAALDRKMLFRIGVRSALIVDSVSGTFRSLSKAQSGEIESFDIIICGAQMKDGDAQYLIDKLKSIRAQISIPVLAVSTSPTKDFVMRTLTLGYSSFLARPYTMDGLVQQVIHAVRNTYGVAIPAAAQPQSSNEAQVILKPEPDTAETICERGKKLLKNHHWDSAIETFSQAIALNPRHGAAYVGRAKAWKGKRDTEQYIQELNTAGEIFMAQHDYEGAANALKPLCEAHQKDNPLYATAKSLLQEGDFGNAASAYLHGEKLSPGVHLHQQISRACMFTRAPQQAAKGICKKLYEQGHEKKAKLLYKRIVGAPARRHPSRQKKVNWLDSYPALSEIISVAKYSYQAFQAVQHP
ncbi:tetratricopeptide repeat protein [Halodesulfovibrio aestuarii]|uniref:tetratricopeptide repeat protein n=1 Tax=Halodesulfovibrio aestuarii TaxID=126333 RepID=UPI003522AC9A